MQRQDLYTVLYIVLKAQTPDEEQKWNGSPTTELMKLTKGNYLLHILAKTENISINANLIVYSNIPVNLTYRK